MDRERAIAELRERLEDYLKHERHIDTSKNFRCLNPQHEDKNPSMGFDTAHNQVHCFSCETKYDILDLIQQDYSCDFNEALKIGCEMYHIQIDKETRPSSGKTNSAPLKDNAAKQPQAKQQEQDPAVRARLQAEFDAAQPADDTHAYLKAKGVKNDGTLKINKAGELLIGLRDVNGKFTGYQRIAAAPTIDDKKIEKWSKQQGKGTAQAGSFHVIGGGELTARDKIILCEGYATSFSVWECLEDRETTRVIFALSSNNLLNVTRAIHGKYGVKPLVAGDKDKAGQAAAIECCKAGVCSGYFTPPFNEFETALDDKMFSDWNDYYREYGFDTTRAALMHGLNNPIKPPIRDDDANEINIIDLVTTFDPNEEISRPEMIAGLFPRGKLSMIAAQSGGLKTWFTLRIATSLSIGETILDGRDVVKRPYNVLILCGEGGEEEPKIRLKETGWELNPNRFKMIDLYKAAANKQSLMLTQKDGQENLERLIIGLQSEIIFIDSLLAFSDKDENKGAEMNGMLSYLTATCKKYNAAIVLNHHVRKRRIMERKAPLDPDEIIGTSYFNRYIRQVIGLQPLNQLDGTISLSDNGGETVLVKNLKSFLRKFRSFSFQLVETENHRTEMVFDFNPDLKEGNIRDRVYNYITANFDAGVHFTRQDVERIGIGSTASVKRALKELIDSNLLSMTGNSVNVKYFLPEEQK